MGAHAGGDPPAAVKLADVEEELLGLADGRKTIADLVQLVEHDHFTVVGALHALLTTGFISVSKEPMAGGADAGGADASLPDDGPHLEVVREDGAVPAELSAENPVDPGGGQGRGVV